jgi:hypothetical protein
MIDDVPRSQVWGFIAFSGIVTFAIIAGARDGVPVLKSH